MVKNFKCSKCGKVKPSTEFYKDKTQSRGYSYSCKECTRRAKNKYKIICATCGKEHMAQKKDTKYCSVECKPQNRENRIKVHCDNCGKELNLKPSVYRRSKHHYCSRECKDEGHGKIYKGKKHPRWNTVIKQCDICGKEIMVWKNELEQYKHHYCSNECRYKGFSQYYSGENHPSYDHARTDKERIMARQYPEYNKWRERVYKRDNYTCQCCGDNEGGNLNAHHIFNYMEHEELRTDISNGITFCDKCHKAFHDIFGYTNNNDKQLNSFLNKYHKIQAL